MGGFLKQSTSASVVIGEFLDDTDGKTAEGALSLTPSVIFLSKNGSTYAAKNEGTTATSDASLAGWYHCKFDATDTNTVGILQLAVHIAGALPVWDSWTVLPANVYDSLVGTDLLNVNADDLLNTAIDGTNSVKLVMQVLAAVMAGKVTGGNTTTITFRNLADDKNRVVATVDTDGNRSAITITPDA